MKSISTAAFVVSLLSSASAVSSSCDSYDVVSHGFNASGSVSVPGFSLDGDSDNTWTLTRFVDFEQPGGNASLENTIALKTSKPLNLTDTKFQGCIIATESLSTKAQLPIKDDGTCTTVFGDACLAEIKSRIGKVSVTADSTCSDIQSAIGLSSELKNSNCTATEWDSLFGQSFLPTSSTCQVPGSTDSGTIVAGFHQSISPSPADDFSLYDNSVGIPRPHIIAVWSTTQGSGGETSVNLETNVVCIPADNVVKGSRALPGGSTATNTPSTATNTPSVTSTTKPNVAARGSSRGVLPVFVSIILISIVV